MQIERTELDQIIQTAVESTVKLLESKGVFGNANSKSASANAEKSAYQRCEQLLYNYRNFQKIVQERKQKIEDIKQYGVPQRSQLFVGGNPGGSGNHEYKFEEEKVQDAIYAIEKSMESIVQALNLIDEGLQALSSDPYYKILEMRYFEGRTQEDIAAYFSCTQPNVTYHKTRLVKELSIRLFPEKVIKELM